MYDITQDSWAMVREGAGGNQTTEGVTPATPAFNNFEPISAKFDYDTKMITSEIMKTNRATAGASKASLSVKGDIKCHLRRDTTVEKMMEAALAGNWATNVLKGAATDSTFTFEAKKVNGSNTNYWRYCGMSFTKLAVDISTESNAEISFGLLGMTKTIANPAITGATYVAPGTLGATLDCNDVGTINVGGNTATYASLNFSVEQARDARFALSNTPNAFSTGPNGPRTIKGSVKFYRENLLTDAIFLADTPFSISLTIGTTGNQFTFLLPACVASAPVEENSNSSAFVTVDFIAIHDNTTGTDIQITRA